MALIEDLKSLVAALLPNNNTAQITPEKVRNAHDLVIDQMYEADETEIAARAAADVNLQTQIDDLESSQNSGSIAFDTRANMNADLAYDEGTLASVNNDGVAANNGYYRKTGASGAGSWVKRDDFYLTEITDTEDTSEATTSKAVADYVSIPITTSENFEAITEERFIDGEEARMLEEDSAGNIIKWMNQLFELIHIFPNKGTFNKSEFDEVLTAKFQNLLQFIDNSGNLIQEVRDGIQYIPNLALPDGFTTYDENLGEFIPVSLQDIVCIGDSMTDGTGASTEADTYPSVLEGLLTNRKVKKYAIGGQVSELIAARWNSYPIICELTSDTLIGNGSTVLTSISYDILKNTSDRTIWGWMAGYYGRLSRNGDAGSSPNGQVSFKIDKHISDVDVSSIEVQFIPDINRLRQRTLLIWVGRNDITSETADLNDGVIQRIRDIVDNALAIHKNYVVIGVLPADTETTGTDENTAILSLNADLELAFGRRFLDLRSVMPQEGNGTIDNTLYSGDGLHLNDAGYTEVAEQVYKFITQNGF